MIDFAKIPFQQVHADNFRIGRTAQIAYIVVHFTGNDGDTPKNNADYFTRETVDASAHYFVDETTMWQTVRDTDTAWHCGGGLQGNGGHAWHGKCTNSNSIGVEMCSDSIAGKLALTEQTMVRAAALVAALMDKYGIAIDHVIRHYDVTGKLCPAPMVTNEKLWTDFKARIVRAQKACEDVPVRYQTLEDMPSYYREAVQCLVARGLLNGNEKGLDLSEDMARLITVHYRAGLYK